MYIISALRTAYVSQKINGIEETDLLSKACWNVLSHAAIDLNEVDLIILQIDDHKSTDYDIDRFDDLAHQLFHNDKVEFVHSFTIFELLAEAIVNKKHQKILIGIASFNDSGNLLGDEISSHFGKRLLDIGKNNKNIQYQELIPFETADIGQGLHLSENVSYVEGEKRVKTVNGVGAILLAKEPTIFTGIRIQQLMFTKQLVTKLAELFDRCNEQIILEIDYVNAKDYENLIYSLERKNEKTLWIHNGGSIVYGNAKYLNGLRAITASVSKLHTGILNVAIAVAITGEDEGYILVLNQRSE